ncbi:4-hydroxy-tetrahydrodipicolinate synthase [subsurface metagenome]
MNIDFEEVKREIRGTALLAVPPFNSNYELNIEPLKENLRFGIDNGISKSEGFIISPCGGGEYVHLSHEEHKMMVEAAVEVAGNKVLVGAGVASCNYREAIELANNAADVGAKCVMIPPPYYYPISQEGIYTWYKEIAKEIKIGIMAYEQPWRTYVGAGISIPLLDRLAKIENVVSVKYVGEGMVNYIMALNRYSKRFAFIDNYGDCTSTVAHIHGATAISLLMNSWNGIILSSHSTASLYLPCSSRFQYFASNSGQNDPT